MSSEFKDVINKEELINTKSTLIKLKMILEKKLEEQIEELVDLKEELPYLIHRQRISDLEKEKEERDN